jgi:Transglycosylase SLT domain
VVGRRGAGAMKKLIVAIVVCMLGLVGLLFATVALLGGGGELEPTERAVDKIPADLMPLYRAAAETCSGMDWTLLAAVHKTETSFGRGAVVSSAGAQGPMQFMPETFAAYGVDGDGNGTAETNDIEDAIFSAANYLCANGAGDPARLRSALWHYNHDPAYVDRVATLAASYGVVQSPSGVALAHTSSGSILDNPNISLTELARQDVSAGVIDGRVLQVLEILSQRFQLSVSVLKSGHSPYVSGTTAFSNHYFGRAVDIYAVNGVNVSSLNFHARQVVMLLNQLPGQLHPSEVGSPFYDIIYPGAFSDSGHRDHVHIGFD